MIKYCDKIVYVNKDSTYSGKVINYLKNKKIPYYSSSEHQLTTEFLDKHVNNNKTLFVVCGGDGTINHFTNAYMGLSSKKRELISLRVVPCGRANDLARNLGIILNLSSVLKLEGKQKKIDLIKINHFYFLTGGGLGLPVEIISDTNRFGNNSIGKILKSSLGDLIYVFFTLKKFLFGVTGITDSESNDFFAVYFMNQSFIGKRFVISSDSKNDDGLFEVVLVRKPKSFLHSIKTLRYGMSGNLDHLSIVRKVRCNQFYLKLSKKSFAMFDGELIGPENTFVIKIIQKSLNLIY